MTSADIAPETSLQRAITQADLDGFAAVSGDDNPIHVDAGYAATTPFEVPVAHGMFLFGLVRAQVRRRLPAARLREQWLRFSAPTPVRSTVTVLLQDGGVDPEGLLRFRTTVTGSDGGAGLEGECRLESRGLTPDAPAAPAASGRDAEPGRGDGAGPSAEISRTFTAADVARYDGLVGDTTPGGQVPEPLIAGMFSRLLGVDLPGAGTNYLKQHLEFLRPAVVGDELRAVVRVTRIRPDTRLVNLDTACVGPGDRIVCRGRALVLARSIPVGHPPGRN